MQMLPFVGFWFKHHDDIDKLMGSTGHSGSPKIIALATALLPFIKAEWPSLNQNGMLDDALDTLKQSLSS